MWTESLQSDLLNESNCCILHPYVVLNLTVMKETNWNQISSSSIKIVCFFLPFEFVGIVVVFCMCHREANTGM